MLKVWIILPGQAAFRFNSVELSEEIDPLSSQLLLLLNRNILVKFIGASSTILLDVRLEIRMELVAKASGQ